MILKKTLGLISMIILLLAFEDVLGQQVIYSPITREQSKIRTWNEFNREFQDKWKVMWNRSTGTPQRIYGHFITLPQQITTDNADSVCMQHLRRYKDVLQIDPTKLVLSKAEKLEPINQDRSNGSWYISYRQIYQNIPVYNSSVRLVIKNNKIVSLASIYYPEIEMDVKPSVSLNEAIEIIRREIEFKILDTIPEELIIYPKLKSRSVEYYLAWKIITPTTIVENVIEDKEFTEEDISTITRKKEVQYCYFIDAKTGSVIDRVDLLRYEDLNGRVTGMVYPANPGDVPIEAPIAGLKVMVIQGGTEYTAVTDANGNYTITGLAAGPADFQTSFEGPHIVLTNDLAEDYYGPGSSGAVHSATVTAPGTHDWNWDADDLSPNNVETNVFYHVDAIRNYFLSGGEFSITPDPYPMEVRVRSTAINCNASAGSGGLTFYIEDLARCNADYGLCADIVYHEYTHRIVAKVYGDAGVGLPYSGFTGAMNEGWSDYFGATVVDSPLHGENCYNGRNIDTPDKVFPDDWVGRVHSDGIIFSGSIWDTRQVLGSDYVDALALRSMKETAVNFNEYLLAMLTEDDDPAFSPDPSANNNINDGTPNQDEICQNFYDNHGIYSEFCAGHTNTPIAYITAPTVNLFNITRGGIANINIEGTASGSSSFALSNFILEYGEGEDPIVWNTAGITLTGGGTSEILGGLLGTWNLSSIDDGAYTIKLTVNDAGSQTTDFSTFVVIDRTLKTGWPYEENRHFYSSPAVADIDPAYPGLEVVATSYGKLHVVHEDGTAAPGFPQNLSGYSMSSVAIGDLNNDGNLQIVAAAYKYVYLFNADGSEDLAFNKELDDFIYSTPALGDLDGDGDLEVVLASTDSMVYAWHHDGTDVAGWPIKVDGPVESSPALGDVNHDGILDVVIGANDSCVYVWSGNGISHAGWPIKTNGEVSCSPVLADLDDDMDLEIVVGTRDKNVYIWHHNATVLPGWPNVVDYQIVRPSSPVIADLDSDGGLEIILVSNDDKIHCWEVDGSYVIGWPSDIPAISGWELWVSTPVTGDIDGDGDMEIVMEGSGTYSKVFAFHHNGNLVDGWPKYVNKYSNSSPAIADLDLDGNVEIIIGSDGLFVWEFAGTYVKSNMEWPYFGNDIRRTGKYGPKAGIALLFDVSGSMSWRHDGTMNVPDEEKRITKAKEAVYPFLEMLNDFNEGKANFGIANFPEHPWVSSSSSCTGQIINPMMLVTTPSTNNANTTIIPSLSGSGSTPLLEGMNTAISMLGTETNQAVVLLSDGYHNCPSTVSVGDSEVSDLIQKLQVNSVRVFTIGFGRPTDVDHPLLEEFADETTPPGFLSSQFFDVTTSGFDPTNWDPATALHSTYKSILVDALGLEAAVDPLGTISSGETKKVEVHVNGYDKKVCFFISWVTQDEDRLGVKIISSDGIEVPINSTVSGIKTHKGMTYYIITIEESFLQSSEKVGSQPWILEINSNQLSPGESEKYQYSVIMDSRLKMKAHFNKESYETGDEITLSTRLIKAGTPITNLNEVFVTVSYPDNGMGNWFAGNRVTEKQLDMIPERIDDEFISPIQRKARYLSDISQKPLAATEKSIQLQLFDDGTHGDKIAHDGIYTNTFSNTIAEGTYNFSFTAAGNIDGSSSFQRELIHQKYVTVKPDSKNSIIKLASPIVADGEIQKFLIKVTPKDAYNNYLGPRYSGKIKLSTNHGSFVNSLKDNLDGTYTQELIVPLNIKPEDVKVTMSYGEFESTVSLKRPSSFGLSLHLGSAVPAGTLNNNYNPGLSLVLDLEYTKWQKFSVVGLFAYHDFTSSSASLSDLTIWNTSINGKYKVIDKSFSTYINAGPGLYFPTNADTDFGINLGVKVGKMINPNINIEVGVDYHYIFDSSFQYFYDANIGFIYHF